MAFYIHTPHVVEVVEMSANGHLVKVCTDRIASMGSNDADTEEDFAEDLEMLERANIVDGFSYLMGDSPPAVNPLICHQMG